MDFTLKINLDNADARDPDDHDLMSYEALAGYVVKVSDAITDYRDTGTVHDANGNPIGTWEVRS